MDPNYNFDTNENTPESNQPRVITITKSKLAALRGLGYKRPAIAEYFGITTQELYQVMVEFGMVQPRNERANMPSYVIQTVNDIADPVRVEEPVAVQA